MDGACKESGGFSESSFVNELGAADLVPWFFVCGCLGLHETSQTLSLTVLVLSPGLSVSIGWKESRKHSVLLRDRPCPLAHYIHSFRTKEILKEARSPGTVVLRD